VESEFLFSVDWLDVGLPSLQITDRVAQLLSMIKSQKEITKTKHELSKFKEMNFFDSRLLYYDQPTPFQ